MVKYVLVALLFTSLFELTQAQTNENAFVEQSIIAISDSLFKTNSDSVRLDLNRKLESLISKNFPNQQAFGYPFSSVKRVGFVMSPDSAFRLITWNVMYSNNRAVCYGYIQMGIAGKYRLYKLTDAREHLTNVESKRLTPSRWFGSLYYQIVPHQTKKARYYLLLGYSPNDLFTTQKVIETLYFSESGTPAFGIPVLALSPKNKVHRMVYAYSTQAVMMLRYDHNAKQIIFDHLAPFLPNMQGNPQFYGPDSSIDAFVPENDLWVYKATINGQPSPQQVTPKVTQTNRR